MKLDTVGHTHSVHVAVRIGSESVPLKLPSELHNHLADAGVLFQHGVADTKIFDGQSM